MCHAGDTPVDVIWGTPRPQRVVVLDSVFVASSKSVFSLLFSGSDRRERKRNALRWLRACSCLAPHPSALLVPLLYSADCAAAASIAQTHSPTDRPSRRASTSASNDARRSRSNSGRCGRPTCACTHLRLLGSPVAIVHRRQRRASCGVRAGRGQASRTEEAAWRRLLLPVAAIAAVAAGLIQLGCEQRREGFLVRRSTLSAAVGERLCRNTSMSTMAATLTSLWSAARPAPAHRLR